MSLEKSTHFKKRDRLWILLLVGFIFLFSTSVFIKMYGGNLSEIFQDFINGSKVTNEDMSDGEDDVSVEAQVEVIIDGLDHPWDIKKDAAGNIFYTQRGSGLYKLGASGDNALLYGPEDLYVAGEGGMLGFDLSADFTTSREVYACFNSNSQERGLNVVVAKLQLDEELKEVEYREDIIADIPSNTSGRHSGCRIVANDIEEIWIGTGDAADGESPQDPESLGGKVLRVNSQGRGLEGNLAEPFDSRIFSYGHRNIQGMVVLEEFDENYGYGFTAEHGPDVDDEVNPLTKGNFGWDPKLPYGENVPMTDKDKFPNAVESIWSSGNRTIAACGLEYVRGEDWGDWEGDLLQAALKDSYIMKMELDDSGNVTETEIVLDDYGRIRQIYQAKDGMIYFTTDNGGNDIIGKLSLR
jgi:glucose/arabinose dehydrogenase